jgi:hypothetical protein
VKEPHATVIMDYVVLGYLRSWTMWHHLRLECHPTEADTYAVVIGSDHPVFPAQRMPWE